jgi:hypothetical protein
MALDLIFVVTLTIRKAKLLSYCAGVAELADAQDLKVRDANIPNRFRFIRKPGYLSSALHLTV